MTRRQLTEYAVIAALTVAIWIGFHLGHPWVLWAAAAVFIIFRFLTDRSSEERAKHLAEEARLLRTQSTARSVMNSLPHAVALVSPDGILEIVNAGAARFGLVTGHNLRESSVKWLPTLVEEVIRTHRTAISRDNAELVQVFEDGRELFFLPLANPVLNEKGELIGITVVLVDETDAREIREARSGLLSAVSHQLKTPLTSIQMSIHLMLEDSVTRLTPRQTDLLRTAVEDADRLQRQIEELLSKARAAKANTTS